MYIFIGSMLAYMVYRHSNDLQYSIPYRIYHITHKLSSFSIVILHIRIHVVRQHGVYYILLPRCSVHSQTKQTFKCDELTNRHSPSSKVWLKKKQAHRTISRLQQRDVVQVTTAIVHMRINTELIFRELFYFYILHEIHCFVCVLRCVRVCVSACTLGLKVLRDIRIQLHGNDVWLVYVCVLSVSIQRVLSNEYLRIKRNPTR